MNTARKECVSEKGEGAAWPFNSGREVEKSPVNKGEET